MALTPEQLLDFQTDLGIGTDGTVMSDAELERLYTRASEKYQTAVYLAWRQILAASASFVDYRVAQTQESRSQAFDHIKEMLALWQSLSEAENNTQGVALLGLNEIPYRYKEEPMEARSDRRRFAVIGRRR